MDYSILKMEKKDLQKIKDNLITKYDNFWSYQTLEDELNSQNSIYFVIKNSQDNILGFAGIKIILDEAELMNIVIKKESRNCGTGYKLLQAIIQKAQQLKLKTIFLEVNEQNAPAINLYKKLNFKQIGIRKNYYGNNNGILMSLILENVEQKRTLITFTLIKIVILKNRIYFKITIFYKFCKLILNIFFNF